MEPIPFLKSPDGLVYTYACGRCHRIAGGATKGGGKHRPEDIVELAEFALRNAEACCACRECGAYMDKDSEEESESSFTFGECKKCWAEKKPERDRRQEEYRAKALEDARVRMESLAKAKDKNAAVLLEDLMSEISENYWAASWLSGLEYEMWAMVSDPAASRDFGCGDVEEDEVAEMKRLSDEAGGWWSYDRFHTLDEWKTIWDARPERSEG